MSRQLRNLLKQNRNLEEKLFYDTRETDWRKDLINSQELSDALTCLSNRVIENQSNELSLLKMLNDIDQIKGRPLGAFEKNALQVVEIIFNYLRENSNFDPKYYHVLNSLQLAFTRLSLNDLSFLDNPKHVAIRLLEKLINIGYHFDQSAGKLARYFIQAIELLVDRLANREKVTNQTFIMADKKLDEYFESFNDKSANGVNQILSDIDKESRQEQANQYTKQLISSKTQGEEMPIFLLDFFENHVSKSLHQTISEYGVKSKQCQQLLTDMDTLTWSITCPFGDSSYNDRYNADVVDAMKRLYQMFDAQNALSSYVKEFFIEAEEFHNKKLQGQRVQYDVMISADIFSDEEYDTDEQPMWYESSGNAFFDVDSLKEDQWYHLKNGDDLHRCRLLLKNHFTRQLIFVNLSGELVVKVDFDDTDYLSSSVESNDKDTQIGYKHASKALVRELNSRLEILKVEYHRFLEKRAKDKQEEHKRKLKAKEAVQKRIEEEKRRQIIKKQEDMQREAERLAEERRLEEMDARQRFHIKGIYRKLKPGALIAYKNDKGRWTEATLSLISKTTQKHIFTDSKGQKVLEPTKQEVLDLIGELRLKVVKEADASKDPLSSLVKERRQKLSQI